jgi:hypothetical protein
VVSPVKREEKLEAELCEQYGETAFERGREFSGLVLCLCGLGTDELTEEERAGLYASASRHLAALMETVLSPQDSAAMTACAKRIDQASEAWAAEDGETEPPPLLH